MSANLPDWMPLDAWNGYVAMRKKKRAPMTERAERMAIAKLLEMREQGQDVEKVLEQSEFKCWTDLYEVKAPIKQATAPAQLYSVPNKNWHMSDAGIIAKARELGVEARIGETCGQLKNRLFDVIDRINTRRGSA